MSLREFYEQYGPEAKCETALEHVRLDLLPDLKAASIQDWAKRAFDPTVGLITDELARLGAAASVVATHGAIIVIPHRSSDLAPFQWINRIISNLKTAIRGTYHRYQLPQIRSALSGRGSVPPQSPVRSGLLSTAPTPCLRPYRSAPPNTDSGMEWCRLAESWR